MPINSDHKQKQIRRVVGRTPTVEDRLRNMADLNLFIFQTTGLRFTEDQIVIALKKIIEQQQANQP